MATDFTKHWGKNFISMAMLIISYSCPQLAIVFLSSFLLFLCSTEMTNNDVRLEQDAFGMSIK